MGCSTRAVPYGSIVASIFVYCGMGLFCGASLTALKITGEMFVLTNLDAEPVIFGLEVTVYTLTPLMVFVAILYNIFGYTATKQSKVQVYDDRSVCCGGLGCVSVTLYIAYLLLIMWLALGGACTLPVVFTFMVSKSTYTQCLDLQQYGFVNQNTSICGQSLEDFVRLSKDAFVMYALQLGGCALVIIGMIHFLMCLSANWGHVKDGLKRRDYESRRRSEEEELHEMGPGSLPRGPRARVYDTNMSQVAYNPHLPPIGGFGDQQQHHRHPSQPTMSTERLVNDYY